ncbi:unnamed protein product [Notodromas monacha]|uniref:Uncharacterized protein n=1 Tax=Notodromas monacha TaxID=399045 RepID=A0A7R9G9J2_9CRUS|nr:unnamed protein product [Notodromas monacha]CAG0912951.1 unnamed protein product [Notodromas monacha]
MMNQRRIEGNIPFSDFLSNALAKDPLTENNGEKLQRLKADVTKKTSFDDLIAVLDSALSDACRLKRKTKQTESPRLQRQERCLKFAIESLEKARDLKKDSSPVTEISDFVEDAAIAINSEDEENITTLPLRVWKRHDSSPVTEISDFVEEAAIAINSEDEENITTPGKKSSRRKKQLNVLSRFELQKVKEKQLDDIGQMNACLQIRHPVNSYQRQFEESE